MPRVDFEEFSGNKTNKPSEVIHQLHYGWLAVAAIRQLNQENDQVEVVQSGSVIESGAW